MTLQHQPPESLAVFPLPIFLLPGGATRLRIFEQRYLRMVKEASRGDGFALTVLDPNRPESCTPIAAWVSITDFATLPDGLLSIDVMANQLVQLTNIHSEPDGLRRATITPYPHWPEHGQSLDNQQLATLLENLFAEHPELNGLYPAPRWQNANWVCARWLELLPINATSKVGFLAADSFTECERQLINMVVDKTSCAE